MITDTALYIKNEKKGNDCRENSESDTPVLTT